jgi:adenylate cyclase
MATEIELKLALPEAAQRRFLRHPLLKQTTDKRSLRIVSVYYDTPDLALNRNGIALRLRRQNGAWLQTVKCAGAQGGGLVARPEWETAYTGHFDFAAVDDPAVRKRLERPKLLTALIPVFETNFRRITWAMGGVQLMLDRGWIASAGRHEAISELELELAGGDLTELFSLAETLAERQALTPALRSKAERGYRLFQSVPATPARAGDPPLDGKTLASATPQEASRVIAFSCIAQMQGNHAGAVAGEDPEYLHQMRVAVRRLRASLRVFAPVLSPRLATEALPPLRTLMQALGRARDLDVLLDEIVGPVVAALPDEPRLAMLASIIADRCHHARQEAARALQAPAYGHLLLKLTALLHEDNTSPGSEVPATTGEFAYQRLQPQSRKMRKLARAANADDPVSLHTLRIAIKRLRYALEFFAPLAEHKRRRLAVEQLAQMQTILGQLNDLANAGRLLGEYAGSDPQLREAVTLIAGWHGPRHGKLLAQVPALLARLWRLSKLA